MLGFKSLEDKLREGNGKQAKATVLKAKEGVYTTMSTGSSMYGENITRWHYDLRVAPDGEDPFEAKVVIRINHLDGLNLHEGDAVTVLYDPDDHRKVAIDVQDTETARKAQWHTRTITYDNDPDPEPEQAAESSKIDQLEKLADLKQRGVLTDTEFAAEKAKILGT